MAQETRDKQTRQGAYDKHCSDHPDSCKYDGCKEWAYGYEDGYAAAVERMRQSQDDVDRVY